MPVDNKLKLFYYFSIHKIWPVNVCIRTYEGVHVYMH